MKKATEEDVFMIVGDEGYVEWINLPNINLYLKEGKPFGLISIVTFEGVAMINSISKNDEKFTFEMIKTLANAIKKTNVVYVMSTCKDSTTLNRLMDNYHEDGITSYFTKGL